MAISDAQKIDSLYKKLLYGVSKTDTAANKSPSNESTPSPLLIRGDLIWGEASLIPTIPPTVSTSVVSVRDEANSTVVLATMDATATTNRTWKTGLSNWIPPEFGTQYSIKIYAAVNGAASPQSSGILLPPDGSGNNDSYLFDYQSGILNFLDTNIPTALTGKVIYVVGYRYIGAYGIGAFGVGGLNINFANAPVGQATSISFGEGTTATVLNSVATISVTDTLQSVTARGNATSNVMRFTNTAASTSTTTGALVVSGGVAIGGDTWVQGRVNSESLKIADSVFDSTAIMVNTALATVIDSYSTTEYRSAKYLIQIDDGLGVNAEFEVIEILLLVGNDGTVYATEYGLVTSNGELGEFSANVDGSNMLKLYFTANVGTDKLIRVLRTAMTV